MVATDLAAWRALVEKELAGASFDKLVQRTLDGTSIEPLYTERPDDPPPPTAAPFTRGATTERWKLCMRVTSRVDVGVEADGGADAIWCDGDPEVIAAARERGLLVVTDAGQGDWSAHDAIAEAARGGALPAPFPAIAGMRGPGRSLRISTLALHDAGADAADELALALSSLVATLRALDDAGTTPPEAAPKLWAQVAIGRDTFGELCKLRALRVCWHKVLAAAGVADGKLDAIHAVCAMRTTSTRDPWVNMLRVTTQVFAAALGGAQLVTPLPFDAAFTTQSPLGQRVARNTALVLREESHLGRVLDAAGGSYYIETRTDALAREAWKRFTEIERDGGIVELQRTNALRARLEASWAIRAAAIAKRKEPVLGVSEFANLRETLPGAPSAIAGVHREAEAYEALRARIDAAPREVSVVVLGPPAEHRGRVGFTENFLAVAGLATTPREIGALDVAVICGSDERYATEAASAAKALKAAGTRRVVVAGRPGAIEAELRAAGVDAFIFVGCDVVATLAEVLS